MITISKYTDTQADEYSLTQDKINSCLATLNEAIDTYEEDETKQDFSTFEYSGAYYTGMQKDLPAAPILKQPVIIQLTPNYRLMIGYINAVGNNGYFIGTASMKMTNDITETITNSSTTEDYVEEWSYTEPDEPQTTTTSTVEDYKESTDYWTDEGTITHYTQITYDVELEEDVDEEDTPIYRYSGTKTTTTWDVYEYTRTIDMNRNIEINMKYRSR